MSRTIDKLPNSETAGSTSHAANPRANLSCHNHVGVGLRWAESIAREQMLAAPGYAAGEEK